VQRVTEEQQEIVDSLPPLILSKPDKALELFAELEAADFRAVVAALSRESIDELMTNVRNGAGLAPFAQPYADLIGDIRNERIASSAEALEGKLDWVTSGLSEKLNPSQTGRNPTALVSGQRTNHFTTWILGGGEPTDESSMNCWEACLYAGYKAGIFSKGMLYTIYLEASKFTKATAQKEMSALADQGIAPKLDLVAKPVQAAYQQALGAFLGAQEGEKWEEDDAPPPRGYLLFFNGVSHVVLSLGSLSEESPEVMSLWNMPGPHPVFQRTTLAKILSEASNQYAITMAPPPW
jgi:hypothetical protein